LKLLLRSPTFFIATKIQLASYEYQISNCNLPPTLDELQRFRNRSANKESDDDGNGYEGEDENEGSKIAKSLLDELSELQGKPSLGMEGRGSNSAGLVIGDTVEIVEGDLVGMRGKLLSMDGSTVKVRPITDDGSGEDLTEMTMNEVDFW